MFSVEDHADEIYTIACRMDLAQLKDAALPHIVLAYTLANPYDLAENVGIKHARSVVSDWVG